MVDRAGVSPVGGAAAREVWLKQRPVNEHGPQQFQPPAEATGVGTKIDERGIAKLFSGWGVHIW